MPKLLKSEQAIVDEFELEVADELPESDTTRRSKFFEKFTAVANFCVGRPGVWVKAGSWPDTGNQPDQIAVAINNNDRAEFKGFEGGTFNARRTREDMEDGSRMFHLWVSFNKD